jgi:hypothetical protein
LQGRRARISRAIWLSVGFSVAGHDCAGILDSEVE